MKPNTSQFPEAEAPEWFLHPTTPEQMQEREADLKDEAKKATKAEPSKSILPPNAAPF